MKRIMLDLETLDTGPHSLILSIGACEFDAGVPLVGGRTFYTVVNQDLQVEKWGRTVSPATVKWWSEQGADARRVLEESRSEAFAPSLPLALLRFSEWVGTPVAEMWGNGADFDNTILGDAYGACNIERPWSYSKNRCYRTLKNLGIQLKAGQGTARVGTHHNALDDAVHQAHYAAHWLQRLSMATSVLTSLEMTA